MFLTISIVFLASLVIEFVIKPRVQQKLEQTNMTPQRYISNTPIGKSMNNLKSRILRNQIKIIVISISLILLISMFSVATLIQFAIVGFFVFFASFGEGEEEYDCGTKFDCACGGYCIYENNSPKGMRAGYNSDGSSYKSSW